MAFGRVDAQYKTSEGNWASINHADSQLNEALDTSETGVDVDDGSVFSVNDVIRVDAEHMTISGISSNTLTVTRAQQGTTAATHSDNAPVYNHSVTPNSAVLSFSYKDVLHSPSVAILVINNSSLNDPFGTIGHGPFNGVFTDFMPIRLRMGDSKRVALFGVVYNVSESYNQGQGPIITLTVHDHLAELRDNNTQGTYDIKIDTSVNKDVSLTVASSKNDKRKEFSTGISSREGLIKTMINLFSTKITYTESSEDKFTTSVKKYPEDGEYELNKRNRLSPLEHIGMAAQTEPHSTAFTGTGYGFDFYLDPNFQDVTDTDEAPSPFFNYFKRGTRPVSNPATYGLTVAHYKDGVSFGQQANKSHIISMSHFDLQRPKDELYTKATVSYTMQVETPNTDGSNEGTRTSYEEATLDVEVLQVKSTVSGTSFAWSGLHLSDTQGYGTDWATSSEWLQALISGVWTDVARMQYISNTGTVGSSDTAYVLISELKPNVTTAIFNAGATWRGADTTAATNTQLNEALDDSETPVDVDDGSIFSVNDVIAVDNEHMKITGISSNTLTVTRGYQGSTAATHTDNTAVTKRHTFDIRSRPFADYDFNRNFTLKGSTDDKPNKLREEIASVMVRSSNQIVRGSVTFGDEPSYYIDNVVASVNQTGNPQVVTTTSFNPITYGFKIGMTVAKLSGAAGTDPSGVYGYVSAVSSTTVTVKWSTADDVEATDTVRYYIPIKAGDLVRLDNELLNIASDFLIDSVTYEENMGSVVCKLSVIGYGSAAEGGNYRDLYSKNTNISHNASEIRDRDVPKDGTSKDSQMNGVLLVPKDGSQSANDIILWGADQSTDGQVV